MGLSCQHSTSCFQFGPDFINITIMRALVKENSKQYFRRFQQKTEDPEQVKNNIEAKTVGEMVGIDPAEHKQFAWFFDIVRQVVGSC